MYVRIALVIVLLAQVHSQPIKEERSPWDIITHLSTVPRILDDVITKETKMELPEEKSVRLQSEHPAQNLQLFPDKEGDFYRPWKNIVSRISRFKRSFQQATSACGGWGTPLPIPPPCRRS
ncbi:uncharacterized protein LOC128990933 [Macrosteles quadrilineatus]|uniref:uncharacterized protein LOC128990933 n=1 Tax=Macrosteles quadrilineatus TaxID=74068 RepID=UPI0023E2F4AB|nr:uncharacterized protein LOC128990933 [Macrosteles quadrilineatus]